MSTSSTDAKLQPNFADFADVSDVADDVDNIIPTYSANGLVRSFNNEDDKIWRIMRHFRNMPAGYRVLISRGSFCVGRDPTNFVNFFCLLVKESQSHWVRVDENDQNNQNVVWNAEFQI